MTDDLVKRLRVNRSTLQFWSGELLIEKYEKERLEAADRIEKLMAALRKYADEKYNGYNADGAHARKALDAE